MNKKTQTTINILLSFAFLLPAFAFASVEFEQSPLFGESNFAPGNSITRYVNIENESPDAHEIIVKAFDYVNEDNLGDVIDLQIKEGSSVLYENTFSDFFSDGKITLRELSSGETVTLDFVATFNPDSDNNYQGKTFGFSLEVGIEGEESVTDTVAVGGSLGGGGGSPGAVSGNKHLVISNESLDESTLDSNNTVNISWQTNIPATSQVVYGLVDDGPYTLDMDDPMFGYPFATPTIDTSKIENHTVLLSGLTPGVYAYRVISRASPPTVGFERYFEIKGDKIIAAANIVNEEEPVFVAQDLETNTSGSLSVFTADDNSSINSTVSSPQVSDNNNQVDDELTKNETDNQLLASILPVFGNVSVTIIISGILTLILILLIIYFVFYRKKDN